MKIFALLLLSSSIIAMDGSHGSEKIDIDLEKGHVTITNTPNTTPPNSPEQQRKNSGLTKGKVAAITAAVSALTGTATALISLYTKQCPK